MLEALDAAKLSDELAMAFSKLRFSLPNRLQSLGGAVDLRLKLSGRSHVHLVRLKALVALGALVRV